MKSTYFVLLLFLLNSHTFAAESVLTAAEIDLIKKSLLLNEKQATLMEKEKEDKMLGVYYCITDRSAGIQDGATGRHAGQITPDDKTKRFIVKINRVAIPELSQRDKDNKRSWPQICRGMHPGSPYMTWQYCDARFQVEFSDTIALPMMGDSPNTFYGSPGSFTMQGDLKFLLYGAYPMSGNNYLLEGHCSRF